MLISSRLTRFIALPWGEPLPGIWLELAFACHRYVASGKEARVALVCGDDGRGMGGKKGLWEATRCIQMQLKKGSVSFDRKLDQENLHGCHRDIEDVEVGPSAKEEKGVRDDWE